jgi:hypothetical protein
VHEALVGHGFEYVTEHRSYDRFVPFETDDAFTEVARLIVGTYQHIYGTSLRETLSVELHLDGIPYPPAETQAQAASNPRNDDIDGPLR